MKRLPDPRVIFVAVLFFSSFGVFIREDLVAMLSVLASAVAFGAVLGVNFRNVFWKLHTLWKIMIVVVILRSAFAPQGEVLLSVWDIPILTVGGTTIGLIVGLRLVLFIVSGAMFTVYPVRGLIQAMVQIRMPYEIAYMVSIGIRFAPLMAEELRDSLTALQLRGVVIEELKLRKRLSLYTYILLPVIVSSLGQAKDLAMSMEMRAFRAMSERTSYYELALERRDVVFISTIVVLGIGAGVLIFAIL